MACALLASDIQTMYRCGRLYELGYKPAETVLGTVTRTALERMLVQHLLTPFPQILLAIPAYVDAAIKFLSLQNKCSNDEIKHIYQQSSRFLTELFTEFNYPVVFGPLPWKSRISNTTVTTHISAVLGDIETRQLHIFYFNQYDKNLDQLNDPAAALLFTAFKDLTYNPYELVLHSLSAVTTAPYLIHKIVPSADLSPVVKAVKAIEAKLFWPTTPCVFKQCPHKGVCPQ